MKKDKRLVKGCLAMIVATTRGTTFQKALVGKCGILTEGPYKDVGSYSESWTVQGGQILDAKKSLKRFSKVHDKVYGVPSCVLVRIDDPDVKLDEEKANNPKRKKVVV